MSGDLRAAILDIDPSEIEPTTDRDFATESEWFAFHIGAGAGIAATQQHVLALIPEGAVLVTEETLRRALNEQPDGPLDPAAILRHLREGT